MRRLLMVGLAESAAAKTMVRSHKGIRGAFAVETTGGGKSGLAVQLEGSDFETVWQLKEGGFDGPLNLNKVSSGWHKRVHATLVMLKDDIRRVDSQNCRTTSAECQTGQVSGVARWLEAAYLHVVFEHFTTSDAHLLFPTILSGHFDLSFTHTADVERRVGGVPNLRRGSRSSLDRCRDHQRFRGVRHRGRPASLGSSCRPHDLRRRVSAPEPRRDGRFLFPLSAGTHKCWNVTD